MMIIIMIVVQKQNGPLPVLDRVKLKLRITNPVHTMHLVQILNVFTIVTMGGPNQTTIRQEGISDKASLTCF